MLFSKTAIIIFYEKKYIRKLKRACFAEENILKKCLSWLPDSYMICTKKGLEYDVIDSIEE